MARDLESIFPRTLSDQAAPPAPIRHEVLEAPHDSKVGRIGVLVAIGLAGLAIGAALSRHTDRVPNLAATLAVKTWPAPPAAPAPLAAPAASVEPAEGAGPSDTPAPPELRMDGDASSSPSSAPAASLSLDAAKPLREIGSGKLRRHVPAVRARSARSPPWRTQPPQYPLWRPQPEEAQPSATAEARHVAGSSLDAAVGRAFAVAQRAGVGSEELADYRERWAELREDPTWRPSHRPAAYQGLVNRLYKAAAKAARRREPA